MAEPLGAVLAQARSRWMIGGGAPASDHPLVQGEPAAEADLRILAVAGQFQRLRQPPQPPALTQRPDLPPLPLPLLPDALRPMARRLLQDKSDGAPLWLAIFAAQRGHVLHPADWLPPPAADLPAAYHPLQTWQAGQSAPATTLTSETWLDLPKAARLAQFAALRETDPAAAQAILSDHFAQSPADDRLALIDALALGLTPEDLPFLQGLAADRSEKVRKAATHLLARLGQSDTDPLASEAAAMFDLATEGLIRRRKVLQLSPKAKEGQLRSLIQTLPEISLQALSQALGLTAAEFVTLWDPTFAANPVQVALTTLIARTASQPDVTTFWTRLAAHPDLARTSLPQLYPRLGLQDQHAAILWLIAQLGLAAAPEVLSLMGTSVPAPMSAALIADPKPLTALVQLARDPTPEKAAHARADQQRLAGLLSCLGLLVTAGDAATVIRTITAAGVHPADPILDRLHFNAALKGF